MPLKRGTGEPDIENLVGVTFSMVDADNGAPVNCKVTYAALCDRGAADRPPLDWLPAWAKHRSKIEELASTNYDNGKSKVLGKVNVDTEELTPLPDTPSRWSS